MKAHAALAALPRGRAVPALAARDRRERGAQPRARPPGGTCGIAQRVAEERRPDDAVPSPEAALLDSERREPSARRDRAPARAGARGDRLPLPARAVARRRRPPRSTARAGPSSRASRARSTGCGWSWGRWRRERARAAADPARPRAGLAGDAGARASARPASASRRPRPARRRRPVVFRRSLAIALAALLVLAGGVFAAVPERARRRARVLRAPGRDGGAAPEHPARAGAAPAPARAAHDARAAPATSSASTPLVPRPPGGPTACS